MGKEVKMFFINNLYDEAKEGRVKCKMSGRGPEECGCVQRSNMDNLQDIHSNAA